MTPMFFPDTKFTILRWPPNAPKASHFIDNFYRKHRKYFYFIFKRNNLKTRRKEFIYNKFGPYYQFLFLF